jgi:hypothetical protein
MLPTHTPTAKKYSHFANWVMRLAI